MRRGYVEYKEEHEEEHEEGQIVWFMPSNSGV